MQPLSKGFCFIHNIPLTKQHFSTPYQAQKDIFNSDTTPEAILPHWNFKKLLKTS